MGKGVHSGFKKVTDSELLQELNSSMGESPVGFKKVTDPALLEELNSSKKKDQTEVIESSVTSSTAPAPTTQGGLPQFQPTETASVSIEEKPVGISQGVNYQAQAPTPQPKQKINNPGASRVVLAEDYMGNHPANTGIDVNNPQHPLNQLTDPHGDPSVTSSYLQNRIQKINQEKEAALNNLGHPITSFAERKKIESEFAAKQDNLREAADYMLSLQLFNKEYRGDKSPKEHADIHADAIKKEHDAKLAQLQKDIDDTYTWEHPQGVEASKRRNFLDAQRNEEEKNYQRERTRIANQSKFNPVLLGAEYAAAIGDKEAVRDIELLRQGKSIAPGRQYAYNLRGNKIIQEGTDATINETAKNEGEKYADRSGEELFARNEPFIKQTGAQAIGELKAKKENPIARFFVPSKLFPDATKEEIQQYGEQAGLDPRVIKSLQENPRDIPKTASGWEYAAKGLFNTISPAIYQRAVYPAARFLVGGKSPEERFYPGWENETGIGAAIVGNTPNSQNSWNNVRGAINQMTEATAGLMGTFGGAVSGVAKGLEGLGMAASKAETMANFGVMAFDGYNNGYNLSREVIGDKPEDESKRVLYALINGASSAAIFSMAPQVKLVKSALGMESKSGQQLLKEIQKNEDIAFLQTEEGKDAVSRYFQEFFKENGKQVGLGVSAKLAEDFIDRVANPEMKHDLGQDISESATTTALSMLVPSILGARGHMKNKNSMNAAAAFEIGTHPDTYIEHIAKDLQEGKITPEQAQSSHDAILTMKSVVEQTPIQKPSGEPMTPDEVKAYAYSLMQENNLRKESERLKAQPIEDKARIAPVEMAIKELQTEREDILSAPTVAEEVVVSEEPEKKSEEKVVESEKVDIPLSSIENAAEAVSDKTNISLPEKTTENGRSIQNEQGQQSDSGNEKTEERRQDTNIRQAADSEGRQEQQENRALSPEAEKEIVQPVEEKQAELSASKKKRKKFVFEEEPQSSEAPSPINEQDFKVKFNNKELESLPAAGSRNVGVYEFEGKIVKVIKSKRKLNEENLKLLASKSKDISSAIVPLHQFEISDGLYGVVMEKAPGKSADKLTEEEIAEIPQRHWDKFEKDVRKLSEIGVQTDLTKRSNLFYDPQSGFHFIDIEGIAMDGSPTNKFFKKDGKEYYHSFERYPVFPKEYTSAKNIFLGIEKNKPDAIKESKVEQQEIPQPGDKQEHPRIEPQREEKAKPQAARSNRNKRSETQEVAKIANRKKLGDAFRRVVKDLGESRLGGILMNWNESRLSDDGERIIAPVGRDANYSKGKEGGKVRIGKAEFVEWVMSDAPFDEKVYGKDIRKNEEWVKDIEDARASVRPFVDKKPEPTPLAAVKPRRKGRKWNLTEHLKRMKAVFESEPHSVEEYIAQTMMAMNDKKPMDKWRFADVEKEIPQGAEEKRIAKQFTNEESKKGIDQWAEDLYREIEQGHHPFGLDGMDSKAIADKVKEMISQFPSKGALLEHLEQIKKGKEYVEPEMNEEDYIAAQRLKQREAEVWAEIAQEEDLKEQEARKRDKISEEKLTDEEVSILNTYLQSLIVDGQIDSSKVDPFSDEYREARKQLSKEAQNFMDELLLVPEVDADATKKIIERAQKIKPDVTGETETTNAGVPGEDGAKAPDEDNPPRNSDRPDGQGTTEEEIPTERRTGIIRRKEEQLNTLIEGQDDLLLQKEDLEAKLDNEFAKARLDADEIDRIEKEIAALADEIEKYNLPIQLKRRELEIQKAHEEGAKKIEKIAAKLRNKGGGKAYSTILPIPDLKTVAAILDFAAETYRQIGNVRIAAVKTMAWAREQFKGLPGVDKLEESHIRDLISPYAVPLGVEPVINNKTHLETVTDMLEAIRDREISVEDAIEDIMESNLADKTKANLINYLDWHTTGMDYHNSVSLREPKYENTYYDNYAMTSTGEQTKYLSERTLEDVTGQNVIEAETAEKLAVENIVRDAYNLAGLAKNKYGEDVMDWGVGFLSDIKNAEVYDPVKKVAALTGLAWELRAEKLRHPEKKVAVDKLLYKVEREWKETLRESSKVLNAARANRLFRNEYHADLFAAQVLNDQQRRQQHEYEQAIEDAEAMDRASEKYEREGVARDAKEVEKTIKKDVENQKAKAEKEPAPKKKSPTEKIRDIFRKKKNETRSTKPDEHYKKELESLKNELGKEPNAFLKDLAEKIKKNPC